MTQQQLLYVLLALFAGPLVGGLLAGIDRKLSARLQGRVGPPILQPIYDLCKLFQKDALVVNQFQIIYVMLHLAFMLATVVLLVLGQDLLLILFAHAFSTISLILGGMSVRSPYSRIGSMRRIMQMAAYEPILIMAVVGVYLANSAGGHGSFMASRVIQSGQPLLASLPLIFLTLVAAMAIKFQKSPFDVATSHHAHQELVRGITLEYSGPFLGIIELTHFYELFVLFGVLVAFWAPNLVVGLVLASLSFSSLALLDNICARLTTMWMVRFMWTVPMLLALSNIVWLYIR